LFQTAIPVTNIIARKAQTDNILQQIKKHLRYEGKKLETIEADYAAKSANNDTVEKMIFPPTGVRKSILILIDYPDQFFTYPVADFDNLANQVGYNVNGAVGSFRDYYIDVSYGMLTINTDVVGWYTSQSNRATYGVEDLTNRNFSNAAFLVREAVDAAELDGIDFSQYDGDNDGAVDVIEVIHSGRGTEESGNVADIWSHRTALANTGNSVTYDGKLLNDYIIQAETVGGANNITNIGVLVHEFGHALGLPDLYYSGGAAIGLGRWCVMASGTWNNGGRTPAQPSAWCKEELGWVSPTVISGAGTVANMTYSDDADAVHRFNTDFTDEYYLLENRQKTGWDSHIPGEGLAIFLVKDNTNNNIDMIEADGLVELDTGDGGDTGNVFPGSTNNTTFDCNSTPNTILNNGAIANISVSNISMTGDLISFDYDFCSTNCSLNDLILNGNPTNITSTYDQSFSVSYAFAPSTGTISLTVGGVTINEAITVSPQNISVTGLPADGQPVNVSALFSAENTCSIVINSLYIAPIDCANDMVCNALDITANIGGQNISCTNENMTTEVNEPRPTNTGCETQNSWCDGSLSQTVWFKFVAPASGSINIDFATAIDLQMALWEANSCQDILDTSKRLMIAANDDSSSAGGFSPHLNNVTCLVPGKTYFLQIDGYQSTQGPFSFVITDPAISCSIAPENTGTCANSYTATSAGKGEWLHLKDNSGNLIASVNDRFNNLGELTAVYDIHQGVVRMDANNHPLLKRDIFISPATNAAAAVRLYLTAAEFAELVNEGADSDLMNSELLKFGGGTCNDAINGASEVIIPSAHKLSFDGTNHMLEFEVSGFSSFLLRSNAAVLPVELISFKGETAEKQNDLHWETATEINVDRFEIQRQREETDEWKTLGGVTATGYSEVNQRYTFVDNLPATVGYYRLKIIDRDSKFEYSDVLLLQRRGDNLQVTSVYPNPITDVTQVAFYTPTSEQIQWQLLTTDGRILTTKITPAVPGDNILDIQFDNLSAGCYYLKMNNGEQQVLTKLVKF
jgi:immune inhibitor A